MVLKQKCFICQVRHWAICAGKQLFCLRGGKPHDIVHQAAPNGSAEMHTEATWPFFTSLHVFWVNLCLYSHV